MNQKEKFFAFLENADKHNDYPELVSKIKMGYNAFLEAAEKQALIESTIALLEQEHSPEELERIEALPVEDKIAKLKQIGRILGAGGVGDLKHRYMNSPVVNAYKKGLSREQIVSAISQNN